MKKVDEKKLLKNPEVIEEINRHLWIESEKAQKDIGYDNAAADWIKRYSKDWLAHHKPKAAKSSSKTSVKKKTVKKSTTGVAKKRRAKSYSSKK